MGLFVTLEGVEGCGKTTQARLLKEYLEAKGHEVVALREPGGTGLGERIRDILLNSSDEEITPVAELFLYEAARAQLVTMVIAPTLELGKTVICDRFIDSTVAYQGFGRGIDAGAVSGVNMVATGGLVPDLTLLIDCEPKEGLRRAWDRIKSAGGSREDRFEREALAFHEKVREGYLELAETESGRVKVVDGNASVEEVHQRLVAVLEKTIG